jgi:hypothetical protein
MACSTDFGGVESGLRVWGRQLHLEELVNKLISRVVCFFQGTDDVCGGVQLAVGLVLLEVVFLLVERLPRDVVGKDERH